MVKREGKTRRRKRKTGSPLSFAKPLIPEIPIQVLSLFEVTLEGFSTYKVIGNKTSEHFGTDDVSPFVPVREENSTRNLGLFFS